MGMVFVKTILVIVVLLILRDFVAWLFGWSDGESFADLMDNVRHNREIDREWRVNGKPIVERVVGWRPDPWHKNDGYKDNCDGSYSKLIRGGTKEYRERFARDVEESKK